LQGYHAAKKSMAISPRDKCRALVFGKGNEINDASLTRKNAIIHLRKTKKRMDHVSHTFYTPYLQFLIFNKWEVLNR